MQVLTEKSQDIHDKILSLRLDEIVGITSYQEAVKKYRWKYTEMLKLDTKRKRTKSGYRQDILGTGSGQKVVIGILIEFV